MFHALDDVVGDLTALAYEAPPDQGRGGPLTRLQSPDWILPPWGAWSYRGPLA